MLIFQPLVEKNTYWFVQNQANNKVAHGMDQIKGDAGKPPPESSSGTCDKKIGKGTKTSESQAKSA